GRLYRPPRPVSLVDRDRGTRRWQPLWRDPRSEPATARFTGTHRSRPDLARAAGQLASRPGNACLAGPESLTPGGRPTTRVPILHALHSEAPERILFKWERFDGAE